jgi:hypothetical protein
LTLNKCSSIFAVSFNEVKKLSKHKVMLHKHIWELVKKYLHCLRNFFTLINEKVH